MKRRLLALALCAAVCGCGGGGMSGAETAAPVAAAPSSDDTAALQAAVDKGGVVTLDARTYHTSKTITISHSNTVIQGAGPGTVIEFKATHAPYIHCGNDRAITTPCDLDDVLPRRIAQPIAVGDTSFVATDDASDVQPGEWLLINDYDNVYGDRAAVDWMKVDYVDGDVVHLQTAFRMPFTTAREWIAGKSGLGFTRINRLVENVELRNFTVSVPDTGNPEDIGAGVSIFMALNTLIDHVDSNSAHAQPLYTYLSKGVTIYNSQGAGGSLNEFASSVDMSICHNHFQAQGAGFGLDLGAGFFDVCDNEVTQSENAGAYMLYSVHDGKFRDNRIDYVDATAGLSAVGILARGAQNVEISGNYMVGGAGTASAGISVGGVEGEIYVPPTGVTLTGNMFGEGWVSEENQ